MKKHTQKERLLSYLKQHRTITNFDGIVKLGIMCPWKRAAELKAEGVPIGQIEVARKNQFGETVNVTQYYLTSKKPKKYSSVGPDLKPLVAVKGICR